MNGFHPFLAVWACGCVISDEAARELKMSDQCVHCGTKIEKKSDIISLNQLPEQQEAYLVVIDEQIKKEQEAKKAKKQGKDKLLGKRKERDGEHQSDEKNDAEHNSDQEEEKKPKMISAGKHSSDDKNGQ